MATTSPYYLAMHIFLLLDAATAATWCVARTDVSTEAMQKAIDYACGSGADCAPILSNGFCYLPNTLQSHASYAFNSYCQRKAMAPESCDFGGTAVVAASDPSYGSCVYPSSVSTAGGAIPTGTASVPTGTSSTPTTITNAPMSPAFLTPPTSFSNGGFGGGSGPYSEATTTLVSLRNRVISISLLLSLSLTL